MLQQILRDMWVDPEILAELDDAQKQTLFCKMREEQVRRWQVWDEKLSKTEQPDHPKVDNKKQVSFLNGEDGEPWVWVMGEHPLDKSIETILAEEAQQRALEQARVEAHQLRKSVEKELTQLIDYHQPLDQKFELSPKTVEAIEDTLEIYCTVDELRKRMAELEPADKIEYRLEPTDKIEYRLDSTDKIEYRLDPTDKIEYREKLQDKTNFNVNFKEINANTLRFNFIEGKRDSLQDLIPTSGDGVVSSRVAAWERRVAAARATDILRGMRARRAKAMRDAQATAKDDDAAWREQERKAKEAEAAMREIARQAREAHRLSNVPSPAPACPQAGKPPSREAVIEWFQTQELKRGVGLDENNKPLDWFHGLITRSEAEKTLSEQPAGSFLVRVSERVWGYAISFRAAERCRHYLVEAAAGYRLLGNEQNTHNSLADLINFHKTVPITESGGELLTTPCPPVQTPAILSSPPS